MRTSWPIIYVCITALLLLGSTGCEDKSASQSKPPPPTVTVAKPTRQLLSIYGEYVGQLASPHTIELRARVDGFVKEIAFKDGSIVTKGALLFVIDPAPYEVALQSARAQLQTSEAALEQARNVKDIEVNRANVNRAQATLNNAQQQVKDNQIAFSKGAVARETLDNAITAEKQDEAALESARQVLAQSEADYKTRVAQAEAQLAVARAAVASAELNLGYTRVYAPITGRIGIAAVRIGALVQAAQGTLLSILSQTDPVWVYFSISEREEFELHKLHQENKLGGIGEIPAQIVLEDGSLYREPGVINFAARALDPGTGTLTLRAEFANPDNFLRPGNYAKVRVLLTTEPDALMVPEIAIGSDQAGNFVYTVNSQNVVERRAVVTGPRQEGLIALYKGLTGDERIIVNGLQRARPGLQVTPMPDSSEGRPTLAGAPTAHPGEAQPR